VYFRSFRVDQRGFALKYSVMSDLGFHLFTTAIGDCGMVWSGRGVAGVQLPEKSVRATRARIARRFPDAREAAPPPDIARAVADIVALLAGERKDLSPIAVDLDGVAEFDRRVYAVARSIPPGGTLSYGEIAAQLGDRKQAREVAEALSRNPVPLIVPCHRVLAAGGKMGGFSASGGVRTKLRLLSIEGARYGEPTLFERLPWIAAPLPRS
jgi:methylated-DNA-[protein]-cysteine S-methyltransferase